MILANIDVVIGNLQSLEGLTLEKPWSCFFTKKCCVKSRYPASWKV